jgi:hypothetical protein
VHVSRDRSGHEQTVGVSGRCHKLNAEAGQVPTYGVQDVCIKVTGVAAPRTYFAQSEGTAKNAVKVVDHAISELKLAVREHKIGAVRRGHAVVLRMAKGAFRTGVDTLRTEQALPQVER